MTNSRILNSLKHSWYHKIWELRQKKWDYFTTGTSSMLVGSPQISFISTLRRRINLAHFFRYSFDDPPSFMVEGMRFFCNVGMLILDRKKIPIFTP